MFEKAPEWISRSPRIRKLIVRIWRTFLRVQRATLGQAVLVARRPDGCVLAVEGPSGELTLPYLELDGWAPVGTQVQTWVEHMLRQSDELKLQRVDGTPGRRGVTFLYLRELRKRSWEPGHRWLEAELAPSTLSEDDCRLLQSARVGAQSPQAPGAAMGERGSPKSAS